MKIKKEFIILAIIIIIGSYFRLQGVFTNSFAYTYDVGRDLLALLDIVRNHNISLIGPTTGLPGVFYGPWWYLMLVPFFVVASGNPQGIAFVMATIGILSIIGGYLIGKKVGNNNLGLIFAGLISVSPVLISLASQIWNPNIIPLFVLIIFAVLYKIFEQKNKNINIYYFCLGLLLFLIIDLEIVFGVLFFVGIIASVILILKRKIGIINILSLILGGVLILSPRIIFELRHNFLMTKSLIAFLSSGGEASSSQPVINIFIDRLIIIFKYFCSTLAVDNLLLGLMLIFLIIASVGLFYKKSEKIIKNFILISVIIISVFILGTTFFSHDIWPHYLVGLPVIFVLLLSISLYMLEKNLKAKYIVLAVTVIIILINFNPIAFVKNINKPLWEGDASVYRNQLAVIDYVYKQADGKDFKYVVYTPPVHDYTYEYLFKWYGSNKNHYLPSAKSNTAFFILEPDLQYPSRLKNWLKQREGDGKIIKSEKITGGIIIQTRVN